MEHVFEIIIFPINYVDLMYIFHRCTNEEGSCIKSPLPKKKKNDYVSVFECFLPKMQKYAK